MRKITREIENRVVELSKSTTPVVEIGNIILQEFNVNVSQRSIKRIRHDFGVQTKGNSGRPKNNSSPDIMSDVKYNQDGSQVHTTLIQLSEDNLKDPDFILRAHGYDPSAWDLTQHIHNIWQQHSVIDGTKDLHQSKITVKPIMRKVTPEDLIKVMNGKIAPQYVPSENEGRNSLVISLFDLHFGITKLDMVRGILNQMNDIVSRGYKRVVIVIGGDTLHSNLMTKSKTAHDTQLDHVNNIVSLEEASEFISSIIEMSLRNAIEVEVHAISGNHDEDKQYLFLWGIQQKYPQVKFDNNLNTRTAFGFDRIGILMAHGNLALKRLPMLFANEYPELWARSKYREVLSGHFHTDKITDESGVVMHANGTPKPNDNYEYANGFTMNRKHLQLEEFNETRLVATYELE